jgi:hypothetical protein
MVQRTRAGPRVCHERKETILTTGGLPSVTDVGCSVGCSVAGEFRRFAYGCEVDGGVSEQQNFVFFSSMVLRLVCRTPQSRT